MHIVLLILKIIGIVLGSILGLLLAILLMILFIPIRYRISAEKQDKFQCQIRVSWFLRGINCSGEYAGEQFIYRLKILGITVKSNFSKKTRKAKIKEYNEDAEKKNEFINKKNKKAKIEKDEKEQEKSTELILQEKDSVKIKEQGDVEQIKTETKVHDEDSMIVYDGVNEKRKMPEEEFTFFEKVSIFLSEKYQKFIKKIKGIKKKIKNMLISIRSGISKLKLIWSFLTEEENKAGFKTCMKTLKKIIKHIKPKVLKGYLRFGTDDPCITGQILGVIAMFYGTFGRFFEITPDFEEAVLEYSVYAKGRVRIFTVGKIVLQLWFSKELKKLIENFENCKEELENGR